MDSKWTLKHNKHHCIIVNQGGKNIGYQPNAGVQIMEEDGYGFKDLNGSGRLDAFEDWRLPLTTRGWNRPSIWSRKKTAHFCGRTACLPR